MGRDRLLFFSAPERAGPPADPMTRLFLILLAVVVLGASLAGCGGDRDKGVNRGKDRPKPAAQ